MLFTDSVGNDFSDRHTNEEIFVLKNKTFESVNTQHHYLVFVKKKKILHFCKYFYYYYVFLNAKKWLSVSRHDEKGGNRMK